MILRCRSVFVIYSAVLGPAAPAVAGGGGAELAGPQTSGKAVLNTFKKFCRYNYCATTMGRETNLAEGLLSHYMGALVIYDVSDFE